MDATILGPQRLSPLPRNEVDLEGRGMEGGGGASEAIVIRSELNRRSEFQRVSCRLVAARMQMAMPRSRGRKTGGRHRVGTDVMYRRRYVFRMQSSEWNARKEASHRVALERGRAVHKFSASIYYPTDGISTGLSHDSLFHFSIRAIVVSFF